MSKNFTAYTLPEDDPAQISNLLGTDILRRFDYAVKNSNKKLIFKYTHDKG